MSLFPADLPRARTYCCPPTPEGCWHSNFSISASPLSPVGEFLPPLKLTRWVCRDELATEPLLFLVFGVAFKLSCSPVSAKLYQASFTLLLSNEERGGSRALPSRHVIKHPARAGTQTLPAVLLCSGPAVLPVPRATAWKMALVLKCLH